MDSDPFSLFLAIHVGYPQIFGLLLLFVLLLCSALISGSEVALFSLERTDFPSEMKDFSYKQRLLIRLLEKPQRLLATILVCNNFINIAIVLIFDQLGDELFGDMSIVFYGINFQLVFKVIVATFLILLFGEILPKIYANRNSFKFANFMAVPLNVLDKILSVFSVPMGMATSKIHKKSARQKSSISVDQLSQALDLTDEKETTDEEQEILESIVSFGNTETKQAMRPRTDIFALDVEKTYREILPEIVESGYSRIPVYENTLDTVRGILYLKDLLPYLNEDEFRWQNLLRDPYFVPENKKLDDLLNEFKDKKNHLAIVVDEYGGTSGLISMEDIIEEIVGEISDEFDDEDLVFSKLDDQTFVLEGKTSLIDFYRIASIEDSSLFEANKGDSETVAGFLLEISGNFPRPGQEIVFEDYLFTVESVDERRIKQIKFSKA